MPKKRWDAVEGEKTDVVVGFRMTKTEKGWLEALAKRRRTTLAELVRGTMLDGPLAEFAAGSAAKTEEPQ